MTHHQLQTLADAALAAAFAQGALSVRDESREGSPDEAFDSARALRDAFTTARDLRDAISDLDLDEDPGTGWPDAVRAMLRRAQPWGDAEDVEKLAQKMIERQEEKAREAVALHEAVHFCADLDLDKDDNTETDCPDASWLAKRCAMHDAMDTKEI